MFLLQATIKATQTSQGLAIQTVLCVEITLIVRTVAKAVLRDSITIALTTYVLTALMTALPVILQVTV